MQVWHVDGVWLKQDGNDRGECEVDEIGVENARGTNEDCMAGRR